MALINETGHYIKLDAGGNFDMYVSQAARDKIKASTPSEVILAKYIEILEELYAETDENAEFRYYDPINYWARVNAWEEEYRQYAAHIRYKTYDDSASFPLMAEYYPDILDSIPKIFVSGVIGFAAGTVCETAAEAYADAKKYKTWGETIDA